MGTCSRRRKFSLLVMVYVTENFVSESNQNVPMLVYLQDLINISIEKKKFGHVLPKKSWKAYMV